MRILLCNNTVRHGGGIDAVVALEERSLTRAGHQVSLFTRDNADLDAATWLRKLKLLTATPYAFGVRRQLTHRLETQPFDVVHIHNTVPFLTGAVYDACRRRPATCVVQHLHNYRGFCLSSYAFRDGRPCRECSDHGHRRCIRYACYRKSRLQSAGLVLARTIDRLRGRPLGMDADAYVAVSEFVRQRYLEQGLPEDRVFVLHNSAPDLRKWVAESGTTADPRRRLVYVGSLLRQKGILEVAGLAAALPDFEFHLIGEGEDRGLLEAALRGQGLTNVTLHGFMKKPAVAACWADAFMTLAPSLWDEPCPIVAGESLSLGIPILTTGAGGLRELVAEGECGLTVDFHQPADVARRVRALWEDRAACVRLRTGARQRYDALYSEESYAARLTDLLNVILDRHRNGIHPQ